MDEAEYIAMLEKWVESMRQTALSQVHRAEQAEAEVARLHRTIEAIADPPDLEEWGW